MIIQAHCLSREEIFRDLTARPESTKIALVVLDLYHVDENDKNPAGALTLNRAPAIPKSKQGNYLGCDGHADPVRRYCHGSTTEHMRA